MESRCRENLVRIEDSEDGQVQFKLNNTDSEELIYTPHYRRYQERYGLYMYLEGEDSPAAQKRILQEKEVLRDAEMSIDSLFTFDANNYELEKNMQASDNRDWEPITANSIVMQRQADGSAMI